MKVDLDKLTCAYRVIEGERERVVNEGALLSEALVRRLGDVFEALEAERGALSPPWAVLCGAMIGFLDAYGALGPLLGEPSACVPKLFEEATWTF